MALPGFPTLLDVAKLDQGAGYPVIDETVARYPELERFPSATMEGATMELSVLTDLPGASFRNAHEGTERRKAKFDTKVFQTHVISQQVAIDKEGVLKASKDQARFLINQTLPHMKAVMSHVAKQVWYGTTNDAKGFPGMLSQYSGDTDHEVDVTGSSAKSSVWFLELGPENLELLFGNNQTLVMNNDWVEESVYDENGKPFQAVVNWINGRVGLRLANKHAAVRIKNIGAANGKTLTDAHMYAALAKCEDLGMVPNVIFGNARSFEQLRSSRTTYSPTGAPAPRLPDWEGIPIVSSINISKDEA